MMRHTLKALILLMCIFMPVSAHATEMTPEFRNFILKHKEYKKAVTQKAIEFNEESPISCTTVEERARAIPTIISDIRFPEEEKEEDPKNPQNGQQPSKEDTGPSLPEYGQWVEHIIQQGCARLHQINLLVAPLPGQIPTFFPLKPGTTITDPYLQPKAEKATLEAAKEANPQCTDIVIVDTAMEGYFNSDYTALQRGDIQMGWQERWTTDVCGETVDIRVHMLPDKDNPSEYLVDTGLYNQAE